MKNKIIGIIGVILIQLLGIVLLTLMGISGTFPLYILTVISFGSYKLITKKLNESTSENIIESESNDNK